MADPVPLASLPTLEEWMDDARVVMDDAGSKGAVLVGDYIGGLMAMMFAATYPDRTRELILTNSWARWARSADYPIGMPAPTVKKLVQSYERS